ncbi:uncharacterized protein LOC111899158 [Lactuca sativa]|uniref:Uncharacterized protein n=1 Tax=Lactuca sativa TaxID=4236 RepID=A0A9R1VR67_LACSA|nr:uncharacterized protein LOC111899158 [Lactuca sativa]KAJ0211021.1 hypothetical protein LSAT_V11C400214630 [Lactuca sativa]
MPTFTTVALDSLIEPKASKLASTRKTKPEPKLERRNSSSTLTKQASGIHGADGKQELGNTTITMERKHHWNQISPALYATPEPTPLPDSQLSFPSSPYVVDHKRRGPRLSKTYSAVLHRDEKKTVEIGKSLEAEDVGSSKVFDTKDTVSSNADVPHVKFLNNGDLGSKKVLNVINTVSGDVDDTRVKFHHNADGRENSRKHDALEREGEVDDFFDPNDTMSGSDGETNHVVERPLNVNTPFAEFYDAWEELATETGIQHKATDIEGELREMRSGFLYEREKRRQAENRLNDMKSQWGRIREKLAIVGLNLPLDPTVVEDDQTKDPGEEICRQVDVLRFVSNSVGKGIARAEMESQFQSKNFEIARLLDRVHYYEAVNHEMSQRNQESVETMRRLRQKRKKRQRWIWGSIGVAITLGSTALAWSYLPTAKPSSSESNRSTQ